MKILFKPSVILGAILGAILGVILLIPFINAISCFLLFTLVGAGIITYLKRQNLVGILSLQDGAFIGAVSGFVSFISASVIYLPITSIINLIFSHNAKTGFSLTSSFLVTSYSIFVIGMLVFFMALLSALFNAFSGLVTAYVFDRIENADIGDEDKFIIEQ